MKTLIPGLQAEIEHTRRAIKNCEVLVEKFCSVPNPDWTWIGIIWITKSDLDRYREYLAALESLARNSQLSPWQRLELEAEVEKERAMR